MTFMLLKTWPHAILSLKREQNDSLNQPAFWFARYKTFKTVQIENQSKLWRFSKKFHNVFHFIMKPLVFSRLDFWRLRKITPSKTPWFDAHIFKIRFATTLNSIRGLILKLRLKIILNLRAYLLLFRRWKRKRMSSGRLGC